MWEHSYGEQDCGSHRKRTCWLHWSASKSAKDMGMRSLPALCLPDRSHDYARATSVTYPLSSSLDTMRKPALSRRLRTFSSPSRSFA